MAPKKTYYLMGHEPPPVFSGPLDGVTPNIKAAYGLRLLLGSHGGNPTVCLYRVSDAAELDFTAPEIEAGAHVTWAGGGDVEVRTWYDQSGNGQHLSPVSGATGGHTIVFAGVGVTSGAAGRYAATADGQAVNNIAGATTHFAFMGGGDSFTTYAVAQRAAFGSDQMLMANTSAIAAAQNGIIHIVRGNTRMRHYVVNGSGIVVDNYTSPAPTWDYSTWGVMRVFQDADNGTASNRSVVEINGTTYSGNTRTASPSGTVEYGPSFGCGGTGSFGWGGKVQEQVIFGDELPPGEWATLNADIQSYY